MREAILAYQQRVKELVEHARGNEQATKRSLIEPLFTALGYDVTDPRECLPEHRADFGRGRSMKPVDYAFFRNGKVVFVVEAKDANKRLAGYDEQLGDYFAKSPDAKLGILTNGVHWRFFTDLDNENVMDKSPFGEWHVLGDEMPPWDLLKLLHKSSHDADLIRTFAHRTRAQNLLVDELDRLLEPAPEFVKLAISNVETRNVTASVVEHWKPVLRAAINEWVRQHRLTSVLNESDSQAHSPSRPESGRPVETTEQELKAFQAVQQIVGGDNPIEFEDTASYFKIHLPGRPFWAFCRLRHFGEQRPTVDVFLSYDECTQLVPDLDPKLLNENWVRYSVASESELARLSPAISAAWRRRLEQFKLSPTPVVTD